MTKHSDRGRYNLALGQELKSNIETYARSVQMSTADCIRMMLNSFFEKERETIITRTSEIRTREILEFVYANIEHMAKKTIPEKQQIILLETQRNLRAFHNPDA